jgi:hypothetical protein
VSRRKSLPLLLSAATSEREFQRRVVEAARQLGWRVHHTRPAQHRGGRWLTPLQGDAGLPDLILLRPPRCIVAELKSERGRVSAEQQAWLDGFRQVLGIEVYVWRPSDWQAIVETLSGDAL